MNRTQKEQSISSLHQELASSHAAFLVGYQGLTVSELEKLRKTLRAQGGRFQVAKARLMKLAAKDTPGVQDMIPYCKQQVGLVFATKESPAVAKTLVNFAKDHNGLKIIVGCTEQKMLDAKTINFLATIPSREVLLAQLCGVLNGPVAALARVLHQMSIKGSEVVAAAEAAPTEEPATA